MAVKCVWGGVSPWDMGVAAIMGSPSSFHCLFTKWPTHQYFLPVVACGGGTWETGYTLVFSPSTSKLDFRSLGEGGSHSAQHCLPCRLPQLSPFSHTPSD